MVSLTKKKSEVRNKKVPARPSISELIKTIDS